MQAPDKWLDKPTCSCSYKKIILWLNKSEHINNNYEKCPCVATEEKIPQEKEKLRLSSFSFAP
jgi:hypothetical protein